MNPFDIITEFENRVADFFGAPYAVAIDSCTHGVEICLRYTKATKITIPVRTYLSIAMLPNKMGIDFEWSREVWQDYYHLTDKVIDSAVLWKKDGYLPGTMMSLSFQFQKHLNLGRGGMILLDDLDAKKQLTKMVYDGRIRELPWRDQNIDTMGYHYYMTPETAQLGLDKLQQAIDTEPRAWKYEDWPDLTEMKVFNNESINNRN